jgi:lipid II:glycine glycyltransferase (peptidoglycan interpeptide bridge formation enzyme)
MLSETTTGEIRIRPELSDNAWDEFVKGSALGQFQQSSAWARLKQGTGWRPHRRLMLLRDEPIGGVQFLLRRTPAGTIGYASKGPVLANGCEAHASSLVQALKVVLSQARVRAALVQPPDRDHAMSDALRAGDFIEFPSPEVIGANLYFDLTGGMPAIDAQIRRRTAQSIRQAQRRGVSARLGDDKDLPYFFGLMEQSCLRQNNCRPNPSTERGLQELWRAFRPNIHLHLAEYQGKVIAGCLNLAFGSSVTHWRKGSLAEFHKFHPNELLVYESIRWAQTNGFRFFDPAGIKRTVAETLLSGQELPEQLRSTRDFFLLGFGGRPIILPEPKIWIANPVFRALWRVPAVGRWGQSIASRFL